MNDRAFMLWLSICIETFREVNLEDEDLFGVVPFRVAALSLSKRLGLTETCRILESNLYFRRP